jgi:hypothetical protein
MALLRKVFLNARITYYINHKAHLIFSYNQDGDACYIFAIDCILILVFI